MNRTQVKAVNEDNVVETLKSARQSLIEFRDDVDKSADEIKNTKKSVEDLKSVDLRLEDDVNALAARLDKELEKILVFETEIAKLKRDVMAAGNDITTIVQGVNQLNMTVVALRNQFNSVSHRVEVLESKSGGTTPTIPKAGSVISTAPNTLALGSGTNNRRVYEFTRTLPSTVDLRAYSSLRVKYVINLGSGQIGNGDTFTGSASVGFLDTFKRSKARSSYDFIDSVGLFSIDAFCQSIGTFGFSYSRVLSQEMRIDGADPTVSAGPTLACSSRGGYLGTLDEIYIAPLSPSVPDVDTMVNEFRIWGRMAGTITVELVP